MLGIQDRLRAVREHVSMSARKLSLELGLSPGAWFAYESGDNLPGANVLAALSLKGFDLHWLLTGEGVMLRGRLDDVPGILAQADEQQSVQLGLGRLRLLGQKSQLPLQLALLDLLASNHPQALTLAQLCERLNQPSDVIVAELLELLNHQAVSALGKDPELYQASGMALSIRAETSSDRSNVLMNAVRFILTEVGPQEQAQNAILIDATAHVKDGRAFVSSLLAFLRQTASADHDEQGDVVRIVMASTISGRGTDKKHADR